MDFWRSAARLEQSTGVIQQLLAADTADLRDDATLRAGFPCPEGCHDAAAGAHRRLHRFLFLLSPRAQCRHDAARPGERAHAELAACRSPIMAAPAPSSVSGTDVRRPQDRSNARRRRAAFRPEPQLRFRTGDGASSSGRETSWASRSRSIAQPNTFSAWCWSTTGARAMFRPGNISRSAVSGEEFLHDDLAVGRDAGSSGTISKPLPPQDPEPLPYLRAANDCTYDIHLEARLQTASMDAPHVITRTNFQNLYWSIAQQLAHHTVNGCNLQPGDLLASGTISGPTEDSRGCMLELTWRGANPLTLPKAKHGSGSKMATPNDHRLGPGRRLSHRLRRSHRPHLARALTPL